VLKSKNLSKTLEYSSKIGVDYALIIGEKEYRENTVTIKNMKTGEQAKLTLQEAAKIMH
jgi:histidyl-tRNA synthetase